MGCETKKNQIEGEVMVTVEEAGVLAEVTMVDIEEA